MAFTTRCPDCKAKLRLPTAPDADENVECPKCGSIFLASEESDGREADQEPAPVKKKKIKKEPKVKKPAAPAGPKKRKVKKKKSNPVLLFTMLGLALTFVIGLGIFMYIYLGKAGKMDEMLSYIPGECNVVRGVNVGQISKYPGYVAEMEPYVTTVVRTGADDLAKWIGLEDGEAIRDYVVIAKAKKERQQAGVMYIFRAKKPLKPNSLEGIANLKSADSGGTTYYRCTGKGILDGAAVFNPTDRLIIVIAKGPQQNAMITAVGSGGMKNKENMFLGKVGDTGRRISAGNHWCVVHCDGVMKNYAKDIGESVKGPFPGFAKACSTAKAIGWWTSYGGKGVSFGGGVDCGDSNGAYDCKKDMKEGPLGNGDDSEIPNDFKKVMQGAASKEFGEFLQYLSFTYTGSCAYFISKMSAEKGKQYTSRMHALNIADWENDGGTGNQGGGGGGGRQAPGGRPGAP